MFSYIMALDSLMCAALYISSGDFPEMYGMYVRSYTVNSRIVVQWGVVS